MFSSQFIYAKSWELSYLLFFERDTKMSDYQVQMASIIINSLKGFRRYQRDNTAAIDNFHVITSCSLNWMLVLN